VLPEASEVAILWSPANASSARFVHDANDAAVQSHIRVQAIAIGTAEDLDRAFIAIERTRLRAMLVPSIPIIFSHEARIAEFALKNRIATLTLDEDMIEKTGFLMYYGSTPAEQWRQIADYVDKILKGIKPADLPVQQGTKFELILNLKTAKALGLKIPQSLQARADKVIQSSP
jgi:putative ABC transport system substrate-binding protein